MNQEDKLRHIDSIEKQMTSYCFSHCFSNKNFVVDLECVPTCYDKYLFSIKTIYETLEEEGKKYKSDFAMETFGEEKRDRFKELVFPLGGIPMGPEGDPYNFMRKKVFEGYLYSDRKTTGR